MMSFGPVYASFTLFLLIMMSLAQEDFHLTILHTHSINAIIPAFEQFDSSGRDCSAEEDIMGECFGGVARRGTVVNDVRNETDTNVLLLDAGDQFGSDWFDVYKGNATAYFMNRLGYDAMTFGNREFQFGPDALAPFLKTINFAMVSSNLNATFEPVLQGLFNKSIVKTFDGERVGIVGYSTQRLNDVVLIGNAVFEDVFESIQREVEVLTSQGVDKIIVLGHSFPGRDAEAIEIAKRIPGVDVIVMGGLQLHQYPDGYPIEELEDVPEDLIVEYPLVITPNDDPECKVLLVHGIPPRFFSDRFIGRLNIVFDEQGKVSAWNGGPISLDKDIRQDPELFAEVEMYAQPFNVSDRLIGFTEVFLQGSPSACNQQECNLGNLLTDSMAWKFASSPNNTNDTVIALIHSGGIRASIEQGDIYNRDIKTVRPFRSPIFKLELEGRIIRELLEHSVADIESASHDFLHVSGMKVTYDLCKKPYDGRVAEVLVVRYLDCRHSYLELLEDDQIYTVVVVALLALGGVSEGYPILQNIGMNVEIADDTDDNVLAEYIERFSPILRIDEGRITFVDEPCEDTTTTKPTTSPTMPRTTVADSTASSPTPESTPVAPTQSSTESGGGRDKPRKQRD